MPLCQHKLELGVVEQVQGVEKGRPSKVGVLVRNLDLMSRRRGKVKPDLLSDFIPSPLKYEYWILPMYDWISSALMPVSSRTSRTSVWISLSPFSLWP